MERIMFTDKFILEKEETQKRIAEECDYDFDKRLELYKKVRKQLEEEYGFKPKRFHDENANRDHDKK